MARLTAVGAFTYDVTGTKVYLQAGQELPELREGELERLIALGVVSTSKNSAKSE